MNAHIKGVSFSFPACALATRNVMHLKYLCPIAIQLPENARGQPAHSRANNDDRFLNMKPPIFWKYLNINLLPYINCFCRFLHDLPQLHNAGFKLYCWGETQAIFLTYSIYSFLSFVKYRFLNFASFGDITALQYIWSGFRLKYSW